MSEINRKFREKVKISIWAKNIKYMDTSVVIRPHLRIDNKFINKFFDNIKNRLNGVQKKWWKNVLITINHLFTIIRHTIVLFVHLDIDTRLSLGDVSFLIGGLESYTNFAIVMAFTAAVYFHKLFHFTSNARLFTWINLFDMIRGLIPPKNLHLYPIDTSVLKKFLRRSRYILLFVQYSIASCGRSFNLTHEISMIELSTDCTIQTWK